jgi:hypothetical protein
METSSGVYQSEADQAGSQLIISMFKYWACSNIVVKDVKPLLFARQLMEVLL